MPHAQEAIRYFRESLQLDRELADARYNLELGYRFLHELEGRLAGQRRATHACSTTPSCAAAGAAGLVANDPGRQRKPPDQLQDTRCRAQRRAARAVRSPRSGRPSAADTPMPVSVEPAGRKPSSWSAS